MSLEDRLSGERQRSRKDPSRRSFLKLAGLGTGAVALEEIAWPVKAIAKSVAHASSYDPEMPSDDELLRYMNQTVEETLAGTSVVYVDDSSYQREVYGANQPVMVLFYNKQGNGSAGAATLGRVLSELFPEVKFCAYKISDGASTPKSAWNSLDKYGLKDTPSILFYDNDNGRVELENGDGDFHLRGGIVKPKTLKNLLSYYKTNIPKYLLN